MRYFLLICCLIATGCTSIGAATRAPDAPAMRYSHNGFSVDEAAAEAHRGFEQKLDAASALISNQLPETAPVTLVYVLNTVNLVDTPTSFTRDMGGPEAPTARIAAARQYRGSALRVIDPGHFSADMPMDCQNASNGARVFLLKTYVSNYDPGVRRRNSGTSPFAQDDDLGLDLSRQSGSTTDVFTIETELTDCFGNVLRALSPVVEVSSVNRGQSVFFFSELIGVYGNQSHFVSTNLNGAKKRAVELVVAEIGLYLAGVPDDEIEAVMALKDNTDFAAVPEHIAAH
ncbi:MAG: hypothetical protein AAFO74_15895 [Pseudomonadota bacterium]